GKELDDRYQQGRDIDTLVHRARQAYREYAPMRLSRGDELRRVDRKVEDGPLLDGVVRDMRSYRCAHSANPQQQQGPETAFLGRPQLDWLKRELKGSRATWKVIAADMPVGLQVPDGPLWEAIANGNDGPPLGRELEIAELLGFIRRARVRNTLWLTADVHYC